MDDFGEFEGALQEMHSAAEEKEVNVDSFGAFETAHESPRTGQSDLSGVKHIQAWATFDDTLHSSSARQPVVPLSETSTMSSKRRSMEYEKRRTRTMRIAEQVQGDSESRQYLPEGSASRGKTEVPVTTGTLVEPEWGSQFQGSGMAPVKEMDWQVKFDQHTENSEEMGFVGRDKEERSRVLYDVFTSLLEEEGVLSQEDESKISVENYPNNDETFPHEVKGHVSDVSMDSNEIVGPREVKLQDTRVVDDVEDENIETELQQSKWTAFSESNVDSSVKKAALQYNIGVLPLTLCRKSTDSERLFTNSQSSLSGAPRARSEPFHHQGTESSHEENNCQMSTNVRAMVVNESTNESKGAKKRETGHETPGTTCTVSEIAGIGKKSSEEPPAGTLPETDDDDNFGDFVDFSDTTPQDNKPCNSMADLKLETPLALARPPPTAALVLQELLFRCLLEMEFIYNKLDQHLLSKALTASSSGNEKKCYFSFTAGCFALHQLYMRASRSISLFEFEELPGYPSMPSLKQLVPCGTRLWQLLHEKLMVLGSISHLESQMLEPIWRENYSTVCAICLGGIDDEQWRKSKATTWKDRPCHKFVNATPALCANFWSHRVQSHPPVW